MNAKNLNVPLSQLSTIWSAVTQAHQGPADDRVAARRLLVERYGQAVRRYLRQVLRDDDAVDELCQEVALRLLSGAFHRADPQHGRFRDYLKTTLHHLTVDYLQKQGKRPRPLTPDDPEPAVESACLLEADRQLLESWRAELLTQAWSLLADAERQTGQPLYTVLRFRATYPDVRAPQMAERLGRWLDRSFTADAMRQALHRAREKFADLLLEAVAETLDAPTAELVEEELLALGWHCYCQPALRRWGRA